MADRADSDPTRAPAAGPPDAARPPDAAAPPPESASRRRFLERAVLGAGACVGLGALVAPVGMVLTPLISDGPAPSSGHWFRVGPLAAFPVAGPPTRVVLRSDVHDAWMTKKNAPIGSVLVQRTSEQELRVFSGVCPHLGCTVAFRPEGDSFRCPCHGAAFALDGGLKTDTGAPNPAPRGLDALSWRIADDAVEVRWVRYRPGTPTQDVVG